MLRLQRRSPAFRTLSGGEMTRKFAALFAVLATLALAGCGYNDLQRQDEGIKAAWSEVLNQYQRRADLVPNLVNTVKGYAAQEERVLTEVTNARANVGSIKAVQDYNVTVRSFPSNLTAMLFKMDVKPNFSVDNEKAISVPPTVDFSKPAPAAPAPANK